MQNVLIEDINKYIDYLNSMGLSISVHGKYIGGIIEHNLHKNPYCSFIKTNDEAWDRCIKCQQKVFNACNFDYIFGMCYAGVEEYVFYVDSKTFISVSGYGINVDKAKEKMKSLKRDFYFNESELMKIYEQGLKHEKEDIEQLKVLIKPLCYMIYLSQIYISDTAEVESKNKTFDSILAYVQRNIMQNISVRTIAEACACSESSVSHLFKEYMGLSVKKYVNDLRLNQASKFLTAGDLPISDIALLCGFANTNYFSTAFKNKFKVSPTKYRMQKGLTV